jgi:hypothetical protein
MNPEPDQPDNPELKPGEKAAEKMKDAYRWWDHLATLHAEDPLWLGIVKLLVRAVGILILLAISSFALLAIIIGFLTVM